MQPDPIDFGTDGDIYNVCTGNGTSIHEVIEKLRSIMGIPSVPLSARDKFVQAGISYQTGSNRKMLGLGWSPSYDIRKSFETIVTEEYAI